MRIPAGAAAARDHQLTTAKCPAQSSRLVSAATARALSASGPEPRSRNSTTPLRSRKSIVAPPLRRSLCRTSRRDVPRSGTARARLGPSPGHALLHPQHVVTGGAQPSRRDRERSRSRVFRMRPAPVSGQRVHLLGLQNLGRVREARSDVLRGEVIVLLQPMPRRRVSPRPREVVTSSTAMRGPSPRAYPPRRRGHGDAVRSPHP